MATTSATEFVSVPLSSVKNEVQDDTEVVSTNLLDGTSESTDMDTNNVLDPMQEMVVGDNVIGSSGSQYLEDGPTKEMWQSWMAEFSWLLHEDEDGHSGYCLYCNTMSSYKGFYTPISHMKTRCHIENEENYLAFKESEDHANLSALPNNVTIKQEFGADSDISAIKFKRISQTEALFNFNWRRWILQHPWLERDKKDMTYGFCKYCKKRIHAEYSSTRVRHEQSGHHKIAEKRFKLKSETDNENNAENSGDELSAQSECQEEENDHDESRSESTGRSTKGNGDQEDQTLKRKRNGGRNTSKNPWLELNYSVPKKCRCKLCKIEMFTSNFRRHLGTHVHQENEINFKRKKKSVPTVKQEVFTGHRNWNLYTKKHPWLIEDPKDPNFGFCKYCKKRLRYVVNLHKRLRHERCTFHLIAEKSYKYQLKNGVDEQGNIDETSGLEKDSSKSTMSSDEENNKNGDNDTITDKMKYVRGSDEWFGQYPWCKKWKGDTSFMYCSYCQMKLRITLNRRKHGNTARHKAIQRMKEARVDHKSSSQTKRPSRAREEEPKPKAVMVLKTIPSVVNTSWRNRFSWLVCKRSELQGSYCYCRYCDAKVYAPSEKFALRHQKTGNHMRMKFRTLGLKVATSTKQTEQIDKITKAFPWLKVDQRKPSYGFCKYCKVRLNITGILKIRHQATLKHAKAKEDFLGEKSNEDGDAKDDGNDNSVAGDDDESRSDNSPKCDERNKSQRFIRDLIDTSRKQQRNLDGQDERLIDRAKRLTAAHLEILRLTRHLNDDNITKTANISLPSSIFNTSAAIATSLSPQQSKCTPTPMASISRNNYELFFESIYESVRALPSDLAAEGKIKIAQLVADLEMRALQRTQTKDVLNTTNQQLVEAQKTSTNIPSPTLSSGDMPTTTTGGLEKDEMSSIPVEMSSTVALPTSDNFENNLQSTARSSTPNRNQDAKAEVTEINSGRSQPVVSKPVYTIKRFKVIPVSKSSVLRTDNEMATFRRQTYTNATSQTPNVFTTLPNQSPQTFTSIPIHRPLQSHAFTEVHSSPDSADVQKVRSQPVKSTVQNTVMVDNGFQRVHLPAKLNQKISDEMGFRRIHLPFKSSDVPESSKTFTSLDVSRSSKSKNSN